MINNDCIVILNIGIKFVNCFFFIYNKLKIWIYMYVLYLKYNRIKEDYVFRNCFFFV